MIAMINYIILKLGAMIIVIIAMLPSSPFTAPTLDNTIISYVNYVIPVTSILAHLTLWLAAVLAYYLLRIPLRWMKVAEG